MNKKNLERSAIAAYAAGETWHDFHRRHAAEIEQAEPWDLERRRKLVRKLSLLVTAGNLDGGRPAGVAPWEADDVPAYPVVSDSETRARLQLQFPEVSA